MQGKEWNELGVALPRLVLPKQRDSLEKWCVIACDQYTSDRAYWKEVERTVADAPSTLRVILPEVYLGDEDVSVRIERICESMKAMMDNGVLEELPPGLMLIERTFCGHSRTRTGLLMALDLERYDYSNGAKTLIRATEGTIASRIPPRLRIRENASLEFPHIMVLIDDKAHSVIRPLLMHKQEYQKAYDSDLGFSMGHIAGYHIDEKQAEQVRIALSNLLASLDKPEDGDPMLFAMGDGNHSFATAKALWQNIRETLTSEQRQNHPARYALCEIVNVHDEGLAFEAIHRVAFNAPWDAFLRICQGAQEQGIAVSFEPFDGAVRIEAIHAGQRSPMFLRDAKGDIAPGIVDKLLAMLHEREKTLEVDYIHGEEETLSFCKGNDIGFLLPVIEKSRLFDQVSRYGPLPRKAFSMGEADEKRCYLEGRTIKRV